MTIFLKKKSNFLVWLALGAICVAGCEKAKQAAPAGSTRGQRIESAVEKRWGKPFASLPADKLVIISPHNQDIQYEFARAFSLNYALNHGRRVDVEWRDVGGGGNRILAYLLNVYANSDTSRVDIVWGGGSDVFEKLKSAGLLVKLDLPDTVLHNITPELGGTKFRDDEGYWCGSTVSGFGMLVNRVLLKRLQRPVPQTWDDLDEWRYHGLIALADPTKSGSVAAAYKYIVQSADDWPAGWRKLLGILSNAKKFYDGASGAADAVIAQEPITACISFYGTMRVSRYPNRLEYVTPRGQAVLSADPIGILKNAPNEKLARDFVLFVLSTQGQSLLALKPGTADGPERTGLHIYPIRRDFYAQEHLMRQALDGIADPFGAVSTAGVSDGVKDVNAEVLKRLVYAAAIVNAREMTAARKKVHESGSAELEKKFYALPDNVATVAAMQATAEKLKDPVQAELIETGWQKFFRDKYDSILEAK